MARCFPGRHGRGLAHPERELLGQAARRARGGVLPAAVPPGASLSSPRGLGEASHRGGRFCLKLLEVAFPCFFVFCVFNFEPGASFMVFFLLLDLYLSSVVFRLLKSFNDIRFQYNISPVSTHTYQ